MNNVNTQPAAALKALLGIGSNDAAGAPIDAFTNAYGQVAADAAANETSVGGKLGAASGAVTIAARKDGWTISDEVPELLAVLVVSLAEGVQIVPPTAGINTKAAPQG